MTITQYFASLTGIFYVAHFEKGIVMYLDSPDFGKLASWVRDEVEFPGVIKKGARGKKAAMVQEWLSLHGINLVIDADFGGITERCVRNFQSRENLNVSGEVDADTFDALVAPMRDVLKPLEHVPATFTATVAAFAARHLAIHPVEIGGQNKGPWVRMYMKGNQGRDWPWCAGFVTFLMEQAAETLSVGMPITGSFSCDSLAAQAKVAGAFVRESAVRPDALPPGSLFLVRRTSTDWTHVGMVLDAEDGSFSTIEGNTNDDGHREGFEVCRRFRGYGSKDFIVF